MDYEDDMYIDEDSLDLEWLDQAQLALKYGRHWAECVEKLARAEESVKITRAELIKEANEDPDEYLGAGVKPTGPNVESYYRTHALHKKAKDKWVEAQFEANVAEIAYKEISYARKASLENLVKLHGQGYFAGPSVPRDIGEERQSRRQSVNRGIGEKLRRTKDNN